MKGTNLTGATWRKSSRSDANYNCVELASVWRKSSRSNGDRACVELATDGRVWAAVRDSKQGDHGLALPFPHTAMTAFITTAPHLT